MSHIELKPGWLQRDVLSAAVSVAWDTLRKKKREMDEAQAVFDKAESEWRAAYSELERLESTVRGGDQT